MDRERGRAEPARVLGDRLESAAKGAQLDRALHALRNSPMGSPHGQKTDSTRSDEQKSIRVGYHTISFHATLVSFDSFLAAMQLNRRFGSILTRVERADGV
jgi:hypothetical protein